MWRTNEVETVTGYSSDELIAKLAEVSEGIPLGVNEPAASFIRKLMMEAQRSNLAKIRVALWPDGTWAVFGFNPAWKKPRPQQLVRAYRNARSQGLVLDRQKPGMRSA